MPRRTPAGGAKANLPALPMDQETWREVTGKLALSPQQTRIVELILRGQQDKAIAAELGLSVPTVRTYLKRVFDRMGVSDRLTLVLHIFAKTQDLATSRCHQE